MDTRRKIVRLATLAKSSVQLALSHGEIFGFVVAWAVGLAVVFSSQQTEVESPPSDQYAAVSMQVSPAGIE